MHPEDDFEIAEKSDENTKTTTGKQEKLMLAAAITALVFLLVMAAIWYPPLWQKSYEPLSNTSFLKEHRHENSISINASDAPQLTVLPGVGDRKAQAIVDYRNENGYFKNADDLVNVPGIGKKTVQQFKELVCFCIF